MQYTVRPKEYHRGYCPTICDTMQSAEEELALMRKHTDFEWEIVEEMDEDEEELQRIEDEEHVRLYQRYYDDEDDGTECLDDEDDEEDDGEPEYVLSTPACSQIYGTYAKALEGYNLHRDYYVREGWPMVLEHKSKRAIVVDGVEVRALRVLFRKGNVNKDITLTVRIEID